MDLSVIIVSYNVRFFLEQCLISVTKAMKGISGEIFVVDNASADDSCTMTEQKFPGVRLIRNSINKGFSAANNQALGVAAGKFILLLNPDTIVAEDALTNCLAFMEEHHDAGAIGVRMTDGRGRFLPESKRSIPTPATAFYRYSGLYKIFPRSGIINRYYVGNCSETDTARIEVISGAFMFFSRVAFLKTGKLDEDYFMYGEDIDYSYRLLKSGFINYYFPGARIIHFKGESTEKEAFTVVTNFYRAMLIFVKKHLSAERGWLLILAVKAAIFLTASLSFLKRRLKKLSGADSRKAAKRGTCKRIFAEIKWEADQQAADSIRNYIKASATDEIIFPLGEMKVSRIIEIMEALAPTKVRMRFLSPDRQYLTGSGFNSNYQQI